ncbi:UNVERIFIED_CONTAM: hypothetical protein FKN15_039686 [Acipenser sinensis]
MERAANFFQVPWKAVFEQRKSVFRPPSLFRHSRTFWQHPASAPSLSKSAASLASMEEAHLKKAYAAEAQVTRLANTGGLLTAYLDGMLCSVTLLEPLASELHTVSGILLQISGFQGQQNHKWLKLKP